MEKINLKDLSYFELASLSEKINNELELKKEEEIVMLKHELKNILEAIQELDCFYMLIEDANYTLDVSDLLSFINFD